MFRYADYIYKVYQEESFSRAAEKLFISQSSLSITIKKAEERIGAPIFNRSTNPITLTEFGVKYIESIEKIKGISNELNNVLYDINHLHRGHIAIGAATYFTNYLLPKAISAFTTAHPNIVIDIYDSSSTYLTKKLADGTLDFLITHTQLDKSIYNQYVLAKFYLTLVIPQKFIPAGICRDSELTLEQISDNETYTHTPKIKLSNFKNAPFIVLRSGNSSRQQCDTLFKDADFIPHIVLEVDQNSTAYALSINGIGATIVNNFIIQEMKAPKNVKFFPLDSPYTEQYIYMYSRKNALPTRATEEFINTFISSFNYISDNIIEK